MGLFIVIRHMVSDSRQISLNYDLPLYKVSQLKARLFLYEESQSKETCEWWIRLYHNEASQNDINKLKSSLVRGFL